MKKNISSEELTKDISKWIDSFTKEEWLIKLKEEKYLYEVNIELKKTKWLIDTDSDQSYDLLGIEYENPTIIDKRNFKWTFSSEVSINDLLTDYNTYIEDLDVLDVCYPLDEAA